jgi:hypothetical protein
METDCEKYRSLYDDQRDGLLNEELSEALKLHGSACHRCSAWAHQTADVVDSVATLPLFDVSEHLTQSILNAVASEPKRAFSSSYGLLVPAAVICTAGMVALFPLDSMEGMISTALSFAGLWLVKLLISSSSSEQTVA